MLRCKNKRNGRFFRVSGCQAFQDKKRLSSVYSSGHLQSERLRNSSSKPKSNQRKKINYSSRNKVGSTFVKTEDMVKQQIEFDKASHEAGNMKPLENTTLKIPTPVFSSNVKSLLKGTLPNIFR